MRIDKDASQELWAKRLAKLIKEMADDGCQFAAYQDRIFVYKNSDEASVVEL